MGLDITITDPLVSYRDLGIGYAVPQIPNMTGWFWLGIDDDFSFTNHAGGDDATMGDTISPIYASAYASFTANTSIDTGIAETVEFTAMVVARNTDTLVDPFHQPHFISNLQGTSLVDPGHTSGGARITFLTATTLNGQIHTWNGSVAAEQHANLIPASVTNWKAISMRVNATTVSLRDMTEGIQNVVTLTAARDPASTTFRIGNNVAGGAGKCDVAAAVLFSRYITDAERQAVYEALQSEMANLGITV